MRIHVCAWCRSKLEVPAHVLVGTCPVCRRAFAMPERLRRGKAKKEVS